MFRSIVTGLVNSLSIILFVSVLVIFAFSFFFVGYRIGYNNAIASSQVYIDKMLSNFVSSKEENIVNSPASEKTPTPQYRVLNWSGPDLWEAVNKSRMERGVNALSNQAELCTIASIRLNELIELGKLDGHEGFSNLEERRPDLAWIFEKYNLSEFLVYGANNATEAVDLWENTLGHSKLLTGGEYVWGCTYAQNGYGVAIAAY